MYRFLVFTFLFATVLTTVSILPQSTRIAATIEYYNNNVVADDAPTTTATAVQAVTQRQEEEPSSGLSKIISPVNCSTISAIDPVNIGWMKSNAPTTTPTPENSNRYLVSFSWWDVRLSRGNFKAGRTLVANPTIYKLQALLSKLEPNSVFVDVGTNVGFITNYALTLSPNIAHVISIEPISYNVAKLCEAVRGMQERNIPIVPNKTYELYHAAAGPTHKESVSIIRPSDAAGYFDRASLTKEAVNGGNDVVEEKIPLITIDSLLLQQQQQQNDHPIGLVKLDVQGNEYGVLEGMRETLASPSKRPRYVFFEEVADLVIKAGYKPGQCQELLESYGYSCEPEGTGDIVCEKRSSGSST
eukprot:CAMPEP_0113467646 /NCGR_PEP_ID=MMETSP0014_2-20120614/14927_1 /TAXON_ID=2857 /ORGANISM="Nitzschia sp." /LENGTH=357 /DNA_ID=CAMNT_0000359971 /DNA_START=86 /DNA_END=1159 /DNA_ORIENTATION=- /assembly_acc=CAM_ASM_000159